VQLEAEASGHAREAPALHSGHEGRGTVHGHHIPPPGIRGELRRHEPERAAHARRPADAAPAGKHRHVLVPQMQLHGRRAARHRRPVAERDGVGRGDAGDSQQAALVAIELDDALRSP